MNIFPQYSSTKFGQWQHDINDGINIYYTDWFNNIVDFRTCGTIALDNVGNIVNFSRWIDIKHDPASDIHYIGFNKHYGNFNHSLFFNKNKIYYRLSNGRYRCLLMLIWKLKIFNNSLYYLNKLFIEFYEDLQIFSEYEEDKIPTEVTFINEDAFTIKIETNRVLPLWQYTIIGKSKTNTVILPQIGVSSYTYVVGEN